MKRLIILSGTTISGAEYVLRDYLEKTELGYLLFTTEEIKNSKIFNLKNITIITTRYLKNTNKSDKKLNKIQKIYNFILFQIFLSKQIKKYNIKKILFNNTSDLNYLLFYRQKKGIDINVYVHDILERKDRLSKILKYTNNKIKNIITVSKSSAKKIEDLSLKRDKINIIYNGLSFKNKNIKTKLDKNEITYLFIGMLIDRKNPLEFLNFLIKSNKQIKTKGIVVYKYFDKDILEKMIKLIEQNHLNVEFYFDYPRKEMARIYELADFLFICSKKDPLPTVVLESFNERIPVIGKNIDGIPEMVLNNENGFIYSDNSEFEKLIKKIILLTDEEYSKLSFNCGEIIKNKFNIEIKKQLLDELLI